MTLIQPLYAWLFRNKGEEVSRLMLISDDGATCQLQMRLGKPDAERFTYGALREYKVYLYPKKNTSGRYVLYNGQRFYLP